VVREKILVVGPDLALTQSGVDEALSSHRFRVLTAHGEDEAVRIAVAELPHVSVVRLPADAALSLLRHLSHAGRFIPAILVSEQETVSVAPEFLRLGVRDCLGQPFTAADVVQAVERILGRNAGSAHSGQAHESVALDGELAHLNGAAHFQIGPKLALSHVPSLQELPFVLNLSDPTTIALEAESLQENSNTEYGSLLRVMDAVDHAIWVVDTDLRLLALNEIAIDLLGWSKDEAIGRPVCELMASKTYSANDLCQVLSQVTEKQQSALFPGFGPIEAASVLVGTRDGREIPVIGRALPVVRNGLVVGAIYAFREALAENGDKHVRFEFANMASHLMRSPLSFIQAGIDLLLNGELDAESQEAILNQMRDQSQRMRDFIAELLEMSRLETGLIDIYPQPVILPPLIKRVINLVRADPSDYNLSFSAPVQFPVVAADPGKIESILLTLLQAAMKRCARGGHIRIELSARASKAIVSVIDDGVIIPARQLDRIFSQFYPVDDDNKMPSTYQLGLYSTRRLIELQNGRVWAKSQPGEGSRFDFSLPLWGVSQWQ
jgi:PAS domain S-box-containing protein